MTRKLVLNDILNPLLELTNDLDTQVLLGDYKNLSDKEKRSYVRNLYPYLEGATHHLKQVCLYAAYSWPKPDLTLGELSILRGELYELQESGKVKVQKKNVTITANIRFVHRLLNQLYGTSVKLEFDTEGWQSLKRYISTRHRLTHPKSNVDYDISESDWKDCHVGLGWFNNMVAQHVQAIVDNSVRAKRGENPSSSDKR